MPKIGIITGTKLTDALICEALEKKFIDVRIIRYHVPFKMWIPWIWKRIVRMGFGVLLGHLFLSAYLRLARILEPKPLWQKYISAPPSWNRVKHKKEFCLSEETLIKKLNNVDLVIMTDSYRLSHNFFRRIKVPCLQMVWGMAPNYMGDSAGFWAFAIGDKTRVGISIIERSDKFNQLKILSQTTIQTDNGDNLRSIKIKQAIKMAELLIDVLYQKLTQKNNYSEQPRKTNAQIFQAPTLPTYLHFLKFHKIKTLPKYSHTNTPCTLITTK